MAKFIYQKKINFYKKLYAVYGLGKLTINKVYSKLGINLKARPKSIKKYHAQEFNKLNKKKNVGKILKSKTKKSINFYYNMKSCRGIRHHKKYPIRGQRTHTNARTIKRLVK